MKKAVESKSKAGIKQTRIEDIEDKFEMGNSISSYDCTGLIQVEPIDDYELDSYYDIYDFGPPHM